MSLQAAVLAQPKLSARRPKKRNRFFFSPFLCTLKYKHGCAGSWVLVGAEILVVPKRSRAELPVKVTMSHVWRLQTRIIPSQTETERD